MTVPGTLCRTGAFRSVARVTVRCPHDTLVSGCRAASRAGRGEARLNMSRCTTHRIALPQHKQRHSRLLARLQLPKQARHQHCATGCQKRCTLLQHATSSTADHETCQASAGNAEHLHTNKTHRLLCVPGTSATQPNQHAQCANTSTCRRRPPPQQQLLLASNRRTASPHL